MKLPTTEQTRDISAQIDNGNFVAAIKVFRDITGSGLSNAKHIIELQTQRPRLGMPRADILAAYDELWNYFMSLQLYGDMAQRCDKTIRELNDRQSRLELDLKATAKAYTEAEKDRDEYKSRLNAMRMTAGLSPLSDTLGDLIDEKLPRGRAAADQLTQEAQQDGFYERDPEIAAMSSMVDQLLDLNPEARCRVLDYLQRRFE
jgi:hypothetical protein